MEYTAKASDVKSRKQAWFVASSTRAKDIPDASTIRLTKLKKACDRLGMTAFAVEWLHNTNRIKVIDVMTGEAKTINVDLKERCVWFKHHPYYCYWGSTFLVNPQVSLNLSLLQKLWLVRTVMPSFARTRWNVMGNLFIDFLHQIGLPYHTLTDMESPSLTERIVEIADLIKDEDYLKAVEKYPWAFKENVDE